MGVKKAKQLRNEQKAYEIRRRSIQALKYNTFFQHNIQWEAQNCIQNFPRNSSKTRSFRYCLITRRAKSVNRFYRISRHVLKRSVPDLPGIRKW
jgi:ribosomal protein S14